MQRSRVLISLAAGISLLLALAAGWLWRDDTNRQPIASPGRESGQPSALGQDLETQVEALRETLRVEAAARAELEQNVEGLRKELDWLGRTYRAEQAAAEDLAEETEAEGSTPEAQESFDEKALVELGVDPKEAAWLHERSDEFELEKLYLLDRATREGWLLKPRHRLAAHALERELRDELGGELYDRLLYAAGQNNRVSVRYVMKRSPGEEAGLRAGDVILRYDATRMFSARDLMLATTQGEVGVSVPIELQRDGKHVRLYLPRGPIGVRLRAERQVPLQAE